MVGQNRVMIERTITVRGMALRLNQIYLRMMLVKTIELSANRKLGPVATTSVSQISCPKVCPWYDNGKQGSPCYANNGFLGWHTAKLNRGVGTHIDAAQEEAAAIEQLGAERPLRLHVVGDCKDEESARVVAKAADRYRRKNHEPVWTYTHAWSTVKRRAWGKVSVLASCDTPNEVIRAKARNYATAVVVDQFVNTRAYVSDGIKIVPCPQETGRVRFCTDCRLCFKDDLLKKADVTIGFAAHSGGARKMKDKLSAFRILN